MNNFAILLGPPLIVGLFVFYLRLVYKREEYLESTIYRPIFEELHDYFDGNERELDKMSSVVRDFDRSDLLKVDQNLRSDIYKYEVGFNRLSQLNNSVYAISEMLDRAGYSEVFKDHLNEKLLKYQTHRTYDDNIPGPKILVRDTNDRGPPIDLTNSLESEDSHEPLYKIILENSNEILLATDPNDIETSFAKAGYDVDFMKVQSPSWSSDLYRALNCELGAENVDIDPTIEEFERGLPYSNVDKTVGGKNAGEIIDSAIEAANKEQELTKTEFSKHNTMLINTMKSKVNKSPYSPSRIIAASVIPTIIRILLFPFMVFYNILKSTMKIGSAYCPFIKDRRR